MSNKVLVTGVNGYIGAHVLDLLLKKGYSVRGTVRSQKKADQVKASYPQFKDKLEIVIVEELAKVGAFAGLLDGLIGVFHVASPFFLEGVKSNKDELIDPAVNGTVGLLAEASKVPTIKRVVITASFACMHNLAHAPGYVYSELDFNPVTLEEAEKAIPILAYVASKRLAEKAAFEFVEKNKPHFDIVTLCPPMVYGPIIHHIDKLTELGESSKAFYDIVKGKAELDPPGFDLYIDVRDLALAHLKVFETPQASNQRYLVTNGNYDWQEVADFVHKHYPGKLSAKVGVPGTHPQPTQKSNNTKSLNLGITYTPKEETFRATISQFLEFEAQGK